MNESVETPAAGRPTGGLARHRGPLAAALLSVPALALALQAGAPPAAAQTEIKAVVTIHKVWERGCYGADTLAGCIGGEDADFYAVVHVDGQRFETQQHPDQSSIEPKDWVFAKTVPAGGLVRVTIEMWDYDSGLRGGDDHVDLTAADGHNLELTLDVGRDPGGCRLGGNFPGGTARCGQRLSDGGHDDEESAGIELTVDVVYPTQVGRTTIRCTHTPLWPQPGQAVTINAVAMDVQTGAQPTAAPGMPPLLGLPHIYTFNPVAVDKLEVWFNADGALANRQRVAQCLRPATGAGCSITVTPTGRTFHYGCWGEDPGVAVSSGFREVAVGPQDGSTVAQVIYNQPQERAVDLVIHPDQGYANGWTDAQFLMDAAAMINAALAEPVWVQWQGRINVWLSQRAGNPMWPASGNATTPVIFASIGVLADGGGKESFADASGIVHRRTIPDGVGGTSNARDGASNGFFTANALVAGAANVMRHEIGHAVFGLSDEYCCDGGYWQATALPHVYTSQASCTGDLADLNRITDEMKWPTQGPCRSFAQVTPNPPPTPGTFPTPVTWWLSDPGFFQSGAATLQDLMSGNDFGMAADIRRFRWVFNQLCPQGGC